MERAAVVRRLELLSKRVTGQRPTRQLNGSTGAQRPRLRGTDVQLAVMSCAHAPVASCSCWNGYMKYREPMKNRDQLQLAEVV